MEELNLIDILRLCVDNLERQNDLRAIINRKQELNNNLYTEKIQPIMSPEELALYQKARKINAKSLRNRTITFILKGLKYIQIFVIICIAISSYNKGIDDFSGFLGLLFTLCFIAFIMFSMYWPIHKVLSNFYQDNTFHIVLESAEYDEASKKTLDLQSEKFAQLEWYDYSEEESLLEEFQSSEFLQVVSPHYLDINILNILIDYLERGRALTLNEAINLFHDEQHKYRLEEIAMQQHEDLKYYLEQERLEKQAYLDNQNRILKEINENTRGILEEEQMRRRWAGKK